MQLVKSINLKKNSIKLTKYISSFLHLLFLNNTCLQEVEVLHRNLERQQKLLAKQRKMSNAMITPSNSSYNVEMQDIETPERNYEKQQMTLRNTSTKTTIYNNSYEEVPKTSQKNSFTSVC